MTYRLFLDDVNHEPVTRPATSGYPGCHLSSGAGRIRRSRHQTPRHSGWRLLSATNEGERRHVNVLRRIHGHKHPRAAYTESALKWMIVFRSGLSLSHSRPTPARLRRNYLRTAPRDANNCCVCRGVRHHWTRHSMESSIQGQELIIPRMNRSSVKVISEYFALGLFRIIITRKFS